MSGPLCIHLRNPLENQWQNDVKSMNIYVGGCLLSHVGSRWHLLEAMLAQDDREDPFFIDFGIILGYQNNVKIYENEMIFRHPKKTVFSAQEHPKDSKMELQKPSKIKVFLESNKTRESCSRLHAELVFKVWRASKPHFFRDHFRNPSSCCTGTVVSQIIAENDAPELSLIHIWRCRRRG